MAHLFNAVDAHDFVAVGHESENLIYALCLVGSFCAV
jgi:hypothetical protein